MDNKNIPTNQQTNIQNSLGVGMPPNNVVVQSMPGPGKKLRLYYLS